MHEYCETPESELLTLLVEKDSDHEIIIPFMSMANELDQYSQFVVDKKMCTHVCPCYNDPAHHTKAAYEMINGKFLKFYGRSR